jgi:CheY-like chemotaxis protein
VLEALKADPETCDIPVMMLSMLPDEGEGKRLGAVDYLVKPVREHVLVNHISAVLRESMTPARGSILVADDDDDIRNLISQNLTRAGYTVLTARNGAEVIEIVEREKIDLILLDVRMPVMDGIEALRHLREQESTRNQSIVMMTASPGTIDEIQPVLTQLGVSDLLQKPLTAKQLAQAIQRSFRDIVGGEAS